MTVYLDNAATSRPKPEAVYNAVHHALLHVGASPGRGSHRLSIEASEIIDRTRTKVAHLLGVSHTERLVFTPSATESINIVLKGFLVPGNRAVISGMEHNAVVRPLSTLAAGGVSVETIKCSPDGLIDLESLKKLLSPPPRLVILVHASNVNGCLQPVGDVARLCANAGVPLMLDASQTAGVQAINAEDWDLGMLACSGHKSLLGPQGIGVLYIKPGLDVRPLVEGGTGSNSEDESQPDFSPDCFESGTPNLPGIAGLEAGIDFINEKGRADILQHELNMATHICEKLSELPGIMLQRPGVRGTGVISFTIPGMNPVDIGFILDEAFDIAVRTGLHCAPRAHHVLGTFPEGTVRVSPGYFTMQDELDQFFTAMASILKKRC